MLAALVLALGCGRQEDPLREAPRARPRSFGPPGDYPMGVTYDSDARLFIVKHEVGGETRMWAFLRTVPYGPGDLQWNEQDQIFHDRNRQRRYDINGYPLHTDPDPPIVPPDPPASMRRRKIELERATGNIMISMFADVHPRDWDDRRSGAYIVVP